MKKIAYNVLENIFRLLFTVVCFVTILLVGEFILDLLYYSLDINVSSVVYHVVYVLSTIASIIATIVLWKKIDVKSFWQWFAFALLVMLSVFLVVFIFSVVEISKM